MLIELILISPLIRVVSGNTRMSFQDQSKDTTKQKNNFSETTYQGPTPPQKVSFASFVVKSSNMAHYGQQPPDQNFLWSIFQRQNLKRDEKPQIFRSFATDVKLYTTFDCFSFRVDKDRSGGISTNELQQALSNGVEALLCSYFFSVRCH